MVGPAYVRTMAAYNRWMNDRLFAAAARLDDAERRRDRGAFWRSIHGTLSHVLWGDRMWLSRFAGTPPPAVGIKESPTLVDDFDALRAERARTDDVVTTWAAGVDDAWLAADLRWFSGAAGREVVRPRWLLVTHFFNHQTHHRGQAHALLTAAGVQTGDTDLFLMP